MAAPTDLIRAGRFNKVLGVDVKVILTPPCMVCMEHHYRHILDIQGGVAGVSMTLASAPNKVPTVVGSNRDEAALFFKPSAHGQLSRGRHCHSTLSSIDCHWLPLLSG